MKKVAKGTLFLIPVSIGSEALTSTNSQVLKIIKDTRFFVVEKIRTSRRFISKLNLGLVINQLEFFELDKHIKAQDYSKVFKILEGGENVVLMSESGCPAVADPGSDLIAILHENNIKVKPLIGPSSILMALMASGFNGQNFTFNGYLPIEKQSRISLILKLSRLVEGTQTTQIFIETPFRNNNLVIDLIKTCGKGIKLCIACDINTESEYIKSHTISYWRKLSIPDFNKRLVVFLLGA